MKKSNSKNQEANTKRPRRIFKYRDEFLNHGFVKIVINNEDRPKCLVCQGVLSNLCLTNALLLRHKKLHPAFVDENSDYFRTLAEEKEEDFSAVSGQQEILKKISYKISHEIAKNGFGHCAGEKLVKKALIVASKKLCSEEVQEAFRRIPLSNNSVKRRIVEMSEDVENQVIQELQDTEAFSLQTDESTDTGDVAELLTYVRYIRNGEIIEDFLFCKAVGVTATGADIFR
jgi:hypothetical protein